MWRYLCTDPEIGQNWKINPFRLNLESFTKKCYQKWFKTKKSSFTCNVIDLWIDRIWHNLSDSYKKVLSVPSVHFWLTFVWGPCDWSDVRTPNLALPTLGPSPFMWTSSLRVPQYKCRYILWTDRQTEDIEMKTWALSPHRIWDPEREGGGGDALKIVRKGRVSVNDIEWAS